MGELPALTLQRLISALKECRHKKDLGCALRLYACMHQHQLESHEVLSNYLIPALADCVSLPDARHAFDRSPYWNEHSCFALISCYLHLQQPQNAFHVYDRMRQDRIQPSTYTFVALLKASAMLQDPVRGAHVHFDIISQGLECNPFVGNTIVAMYGKCHLLPEAQHVLDRLPNRDVVSWTALIEEYVEHGLSEEALDCFKRLQLEGISPNATTLVCSLNACGIKSDTQKGWLLCTEIVKKGYEGDISIGSAMVDMYGKCNSLSEAQRVFEKLPARDVVCWNALIAGYACNGFGEEAQNCYIQMQLQEVLPVSVTFVFSLKACGTIQALTMGRIIHGDVIRRGFENESYVSNALVDMYAKCGSLVDAQEVLYRMPDRDVISWNALIAGYSEHGLGKEALSCFQKQQLEGFSPLPVTFVCSLKACGIIGDLEMGEKLHAYATKTGVEGEVFVGTGIVDMYAKCGYLSEAQEAFDLLQVKVEISWNALIAGYAKYNVGEEALKLYERMQSENVSPDSATLLCTSKSCGIIGDVEAGQQVHHEIIKRGFEEELDTGNTLLDMYYKCGLLLEAQYLFDQLSARNIVSWTARIAGCHENGLGKEALNCFEQMKLEGVYPDVTVLVCSLKACGVIGASEKGQELCCELIKRGLEREPYVGQAIVDVYARGGLLAEAQDMFDRLPIRDAVSWDALIAGYAEHGCSQNSLDCFKQMQIEGVSPLAITFACRINACAITGALETGQRLHTELLKHGLEVDLFVGNTLLDMYRKCGSPSEGRQVFDKLPLRDVVSWNTMITGYGENQEGGLAVKCFQEMQKHGITPDAVTFTCLLAACSHASLVFEGQMFFKMMTEEYAIVPIPEHYSCIVDLLARSGHVCEAEKFVDITQCFLSEEILRALLTACKSYSKLELGFRCFQHLLLIGREDATAYSLMVDIFSGAGMWNDADAIEKMRKQSEVQKKPASVKIEINKQLHEFVVGALQSKGLSAVLGQLSLRMEEDGYVPNLDLVLRV